MKKKNLLLILGGVFVAAALCAMLLFVFSGDGGEVPEAEAVELEGAWKVAAYVQAGATTLPEREYFVFSGETVKAYRNDNSQPIATSAYTFTPAAVPNWELNLSEIGRKYSVSVITENYIRLYESSSVYLELIRYANVDLLDLEFEQDVVVGTWDVVYRNTSEVITEEKISFGNGILDDYRNGSQEPVASVPYYWNESGNICVDALGAEMQCYPLSEDILMLVEVATGCVWELRAVK